MSSVRGISLRLWEGPLVSAPATLFLSSYLTRTDAKPRSGILANISIACFLDWSFACSVANPPRRLAAILPHLVVAFLPSYRFRHADQAWNIACLFRTVSLNLFLSFLGGRLLCGRLTFLASFRCSSALSSVQLCRPFLNFPNLSANSSGGRFRLVDDVKSRGHFL